jgi:DnaK suppressor protein
MAEIRSARRLMEDYERYVMQLAELRALLEERLVAARAELDGATATARPHGDRAARARRDAAEAEAAIERMDRGLYGVCTGCGAFIPVAALRLAPQRQECAACHGRARLTA